MELRDLAEERYVSLTTFKRDGTPVSTPVWVAGYDGSLLVWTGAETWKAKRIRHNAHVRVAASNASGKAHGPAIDATAAILAETERVQELLTRKYGLTYRLVRMFNALIRWIRRRPAPESVTLEITSR
jgi:PPOX class probable F420-dependent enzyme